MFRQAQHANKKSTLNLPKGWETKKLIEVCKFQNGFAFKSKTFKDSGTPVVRITNIQNEVLDLEKIVYVDRTDYDKDLTKYEIVKGDLLIAMSGATTGKIGIHKSDEVLLLNQRVGKFESLEDLLNEYLFYFLSTKVEESLNISAGSAQPNLSTEQIKSFQIPIPPLSEQKQIVAILDKAFTAIDQAKANIEKNIANAKELFQSKLNAIFSHPSTGSGGKANTEPAEVWEEKSWKEILEIRSGRNQKAVENTKGKYPIIGSAGKVMNYADDYLCDEGTTIIGRKGTINNPIYMETKFWNVDTAFGLHATECLDKEFLYFFCLSYDFTLRDKGSGRPSLVKKDLLTMRMPLPEMSVQRKVVEQCKKLNENLNELKNEYNKKSNSLEDLKKSLLQKAFAGELTQKEVILN